MNDYNPSLEPKDPGYVPHPGTLKSATRNKQKVYTDLVNRPHTPGPLCIAQRGKCLVVAAGHVSICPLAIARRQFPC